MNPEHISSPETAARVLAELKRRAHMREVAVGVRELGDALGVGRSTASRALRRLADEGRIVLVRRGTGDRYPSRWLIAEEVS